MPAACFPCGTSAAATWDISLIARGATLMGKEAIAKGASVILGPTTNMQRGPLGGRAFESFSEDPVLAGAMTAATINGIQETGVGATPKHFVCNDYEDQRMACSSIVTERALREIYLMPFQIAQRDSKPMCYMSSYNKVNGVHPSDDPRLLKTILREEWGFDGMVMSDWFGMYSTSDSIKAGLDLEMPGPAVLRGAQVGYALNCGKLHEHDVDYCVRNVLNLVKKAIPLAIPERAPEGGLDTPETAMQLRELSSNGIVLLKNDNDVLPLSSSKTTAIIGSNASFAAISGGGSAALQAYYTITPVQGVRNVVKDAKYILGAKGWKKLPLMTRLTLTQGGESGMTMKVYLEPPNTQNRIAADEIHVRESLCFLADYSHPRVTTNIYWVTCEGLLTAEESREYEFSCSVAGTAKVYVNGKVVVDNETKQIAGDSFFGFGTREEVGTMLLEQGQTYHILMEFATMPSMTFNPPGMTNFGAGGFRLGCERKIDAKRELERAVELAKSVEQVVLVCGLNGDWESEGYDRADMDLPPGSDELISAIVAANTNTVVVNQSGTPVTMPWRHEANAIVQAWYGGNETGNAIADVLFGKVNPSGKLPLSFPIRNEDNPAYLNFKSNRQRILYGEDVYIGYSFETSNLRTSATADDLVVRVDVTNTGKLKGSQVVQVYIKQEKPSIGRPEKELKGFTKLEIDAGKTVKDVEVKIQKKYATSFWDEDRDAWISEKGKYFVLVGDSSASTPLQGEFEIAKTSWWNGL
ncbi:beta-glucosidase [Elasticomyces elasticus]|nr:beta-glucosidase [Elasticomyces elasticus]